ncbi:MAG: hypothetical protein P8188_06790, partial [Gemmatimonadota bacterium]
AAGHPGVLVCIESAWSRLALGHVRNGAGWLLNVTNDAWLGEAPLLSRTPAFGQHPWHLVLRSVETGRGALRVANNGWTGSVDPLGRWEALLPPHRPGVAVATVTGLPTDTLLVRTGSWIGPLCGLVLILGVLLPPVRVRA